MLAARFPRQASERRHSKYNSHYRKPTETISLLNTSICLRHALSIKQRQPNTVSLNGSAGMSRRAGRSWLLLFALALRFRVCFRSLFPRRCLLLLLCSACFIPFSFLFALSFSFRSSVCAQSLSLFPLRSSFFPLLSPSSVSLFPLASSPFLLAIVLLSSFFVFYFCFRSFLLFFFLFPLPFRSCFRMGH